MRRGGNPDLGVDDDSDVSGLASVVRIDRREDIAAICGRIDTAPTAAVVIHAPEGNRELSTELGMRRFARHVQEVGRVAAIATPSTSLAARARQLRIPVARQPEHVRWDAGGRRVVRLGGRNFAPPAIGRYVQPAAIVLIVLLIVGLALTMGPSATVIAYPPVEQVSKVVIVTASKGFDSVDPVSLKVPAREISVTKTLTLTLPVTGKAVVGATPAKAGIVISNAPAEMTIPAGTVVEAGPGSIAFTFDSETKVATGATTTAAVTAMRPGTGGNVAAGTITRWRETRFRLLAVTNPDPAGGGLDEERPGVAEADITAINALAANLSKSTALKEEMARSRPHDAIFLDTAETTVEPGKPSAPAGSPADYLFLDVEVKVTALAVTEAVLDEVARAVLSPPGSGGEFVPGSVSAVETGARDVDSDSGEVSTELRLRGSFARGVSAEGLKDAVKGKSSDAARSTLKERYGIQDAEVKVSPGWAPRLPRFSFRISVELKSRPTEDRPLPNPNDASATPAISATPNPGP